MFCADGRTGGQTDMTKLIVAIRNFAKAHVNFCEFLFRQLCLQHMR
jgi:hypothetical protein